MLSYSECVILSVGRDSSVTLSPLDGTLMFGVVALVLQDTSCRSAEEAATGSVSSYFQHVHLFSKRNCFFLNMIKFNFFVKFVSNKVKVIFFIYNPSF